MKTILSPVLLSVLVFFTMGGEAQAYFDAGTGSMLLQALAGGLVAFTIFWRRIRDALRNLFTRKNKEL